MSATRKNDDGLGGCLGCFGVLIVIGVVVGTLISIAAMIDPFAWMPAVGEIWEDCDSGAPEGACDLANRFPGFWGHAALNLLYAAATVIALVALGGAVKELREARR